MLGEAFMCLWVSLRKLGFSKGSIVGLHMDVCLVYNYNDKSLAHHNIIYVCSYGKTLLPDDIPLCFSCI